ncbi:unnamed protein product [Pseudo-nitzschia multistriata]|uniref:Coenzyme Q-binding protein COQ10 START domain-containing protein n=1 Tax=Pseudo-nitzschia multistriata TaxID=183589 RepID=A0A448Z0N5_9STRA|nr:unnamed protein product [Pseudo-nitzschia multistriata]
MTNTARITSSRRRPRNSATKKTDCLRLPSLVLLLLSISQFELSSSFGLNNPSTRGPGFKTVSSSTAARKGSTSSSLLRRGSLERTRSCSSNIIKSSPSALNVWWFGGDQNEPQNDDESCELVAVRIERPTSNSRKIAGELSIPGVTVEDAWSILTDYNRLSIHVPNLKESRIVREYPSIAFSGGQSEPGDGSYKCQLYQVGAQKIIGFDFSASVTMDMTEEFLSASTSNARKIFFKCADSQFFSTFDGAWTVQEQRNSVTGEKEVLCSYDVLVKPKGPVPVAALEWRIREDVPTNLRAVKAATMAKVGVSSSTELATVGAAPEANGTKSRGQNGSSRLQNASNGVPTMRMGARRQRQLAAVMVDWERGETMAKYLE